MSCSLLLACFLVVYLFVLWLLDCLSGLGGWEFFPFYFHCLLVAGVLCTCTFMARATNEFAPPIGFLVTPYMHISDQIMQCTCTMYMHVYKHIIYMYMHVHVHVDGCCDVIWSGVPSVSVDEED